jgi:RNA polymerase sigma factor (sigma-70 family)
VSTVNAQDVLDRAGFEAFYASNFGRATGYAVRLGARGPDAQDLAQEAMLRTLSWVAVAPQPESAARGYLYTTLQRLFIDGVRRRRFVADERGVEFDTVVAVDAMCPHAEAVRAEQRRALGCALASMGPRDRSLLIDSTVHGIPDDDLAERYGATPNTLRVRRFRARERLRPQLEHLRAAPVPLLLLAKRRVAHAWRSVSRWFHDASGMTTAAQTVSLVAAVLTLTAAPLPGRIAEARPASPRAEATPAMVAPPVPLERAPAAREAPAVSSRGRHQHLARPLAPVRIARERPKDHRPLGPRPRLCVDTTCPLGPVDGADDLVLHLGPGGDYHVRQGTAPVCAVTPDTPVADCHTEGSPDYAVPPPPHV